MISGKKIAIFGLGKEGVVSANYLSLNNQIVIIDEKAKEDIDPAIFNAIKAQNTKFYLGGDYPKNEPFDLVVRSPGIKLEHPVIEALTSRGAALTSAIKIFFDECPCPIIGITGTKGKGTTSTLIYEMIKADGKDVYLGGNIGNSPLEFLNDLAPNNFVVLELSSFQLVDLTKSPHIAVVLMLTSEHLDWHKDTQEYVNAKSAIVSHQSKGDFAVINQDFESSKSFAKKTQAKVLFFSAKNKTNGLYLNGDELVSDITKEVICRVQDVFIPGRHNIQNVLAASAVAKILNIDTKKIKEVVKTFKGLPHRLQLVGMINGIKFYNDSFSTTPETTIAAIESFKEPKILILGGSSKNSDFSSLAAKVHEDKTLKALILIGAETKRIKGAIENAGGFNGKIIEGLDSMEEVVIRTKQLAQEDYVVILSPACASFDMFKNYKDRGEQFINAVAKLSKQ